jgi:serine/threonine protein kinase
LIFPSMSGSLVEFREPLERRARVIQANMELPILLGQVIANKYRVDRVIGTGGMGIVFAGVHMELDQPVAIKFLSAGPGLAHEAAVRFRREARAAAKIHSEHVVRVFDVGLFEETLPYFVMELLEGNDLEQEVEARGALPAAEAVSYVLQAIDAIAEAHAAGIIHRDLKPTNLYLAQRSDGARIVKVLDFGISKSIVNQQREVALTRTAAFVGSPLYMSPEQMRSARNVDARTDIWALGTILYVLLTAQLPYNGESLPELCMAVMNEQPRALRSLVPDAPAELEQILFKCLAREREDRYGTVAELAAELVKFLPDMRPYAERAARVLNRSSIESPSFAPSAPPFPPSTLPPQRGAEQRPRSPVPSNLPGATQSAWGKSGRGTLMRKRLPAIVVGGGALLAVFIYVFSRGTTAPKAPSSTVTEVNAAEPLDRVPEEHERARPMDAATPDAEAAPAQTPSAQPQAHEPEKPEPAPSVTPTPRTIRRGPIVSAGSRAVGARVGTVGTTGASSPVPYLGGRR